MILFSINFFFAILFTVLAFDASKWTGRTGAVIFYLVIAGMCLFSCVYSIMNHDSEPVKPVVNKFLLV